MKRVHFSKPIGAAGADGEPWVTRARSRRLVISLVCLGLAVAVVAPVPAEAQSGPKRGGSVTYMTNAELGAGFDPVALTSTSSSVADGRAGYLVYDELVYQDPKTNDIVPGIAQSVTSPDAKNWTVKLRPKVKFSDGTSFNANAVVYNWGRHLVPANKSLSIGAVSAMAEFRAVDDLTVLVTLKIRDSQWPRTLARQLGFIGSPKAFQEKGAGFTRDPVGAGPFMLKEWVRDDHMTFVRNPNYWNSPRPYLDQVILRPVLDDGQRYNAVRGGQAEMEYTISAILADKAKKAGLSVNSLTQSGGRSLAFNMTKPPFNNSKARKAVALAIDTDLFRRIADKSLSAAAPTLFESDSPFYDKSIPFPKSNRDEAQKLFDEIGGLSFSIISSTATRSEVEALQALLSTYNGVKVTVNPVATATLVGTVSGKQYQAALWGINFFDPEPNAYQWYQSGNPRNWSGYSSAAMDAALQKAHITVDPKVRINAYKTVQRLIIQDTTDVYLKRSQYFTVYKPKVQGLQMFEDGIPYFDRMWLK